MKIQLDDDTYIEADTASWNLVSVRPTINPRTGKTEKDKDGNLRTSKEMTYHARLSHALTTYLDNSLKPAKNLIDLRDKIGQAEGKICAIEDDVRKALLQRMKRNA